MNENINDQNVVCVFYTFLNFKHNRLNNNGKHVKYLWKED